jgi:hypothetical protein
MKISFILLPLLMMNSCALRRRPAVATPNVSGRSDSELQLSQAAWDHAQCYLTSEPYSGQKVEAKISECKQLVLGKLSHLENAKALHDYFEKYYPTAGDALAGTRMNSPCGICVLKSSKAKIFLIPHKHRHPKIR